jgi:Protein of unknown function with PCYCGC motif
MKIAKVTAWICILSLAVLSAGSGFGADKEKEFNEIGKMKEKELASRAMAALDRKYSGEDWEKYKFPKYVYINNAVTTGYKIAVKEPQLLAKFPCYCLCEVMGHKNLSYCFLEKGVPGKFNDHASTCNICYTQAMRVFLWNELGATEAEMLKALKEIYG